MPDASRCPACREKVHPFAATCPSCLADLDAHRRRRATNPPKRPPITLPRMDRDMADVVVVGAILVLLSLYAPLWGALVSLIVVLYSNMNSMVWRRNVAIICAVLGIFNLIWPTVLNTAIII